MDQKNYKIPEEKGSPINGLPRKIEEWRPVLYQLAATGFSYPEASLVDALTSGKFVAGMKEVSRRFRLDLEGELGSIEENLTDRDPDSLLEEIEAEFVKLFLADVGGARVKPYGSYYLDGGIMGESADQVAARYADSGFLKREDFHGQPDHISVELEYLYKLTQVPENGNSGDEIHTRQLDFYEELLRPWIGEFVDKVKVESDVRFYGALAEWVRRGLEADRKLLKRLLTEDEAGSEETRRPGGTTSR